MAEAAVRVALLARPGEAREQLRRALAELGADLVAEGDPGQLDPAEVEAQSPSVVLVSLEPAIEDALDRFDGLLARPGVEVMYDDAEVTRQLDGWDLARWARHLAAKLVGGDVLPPPPGGADHVPVLDLAPEPGAPPTPAQEMANEKFADYAAESVELAEWVPSEPSLVLEVAADDADPVPAPAAPDAAPEDLLDLDLGDLAQALGPLDAAAEPQPIAAPAAASDELGDLDFDATLLDIDLSALPDEGARMVVADDPAEAAAGGEPLLADLELAGDAVDFSRFSSDDDHAPAAELDADVAALAAQLDALEAPVREEPRELAFERPDEPAAEPPSGLDALPKPAMPIARPTAPAPAPAAAKPSIFGDLSLAPLDDAPGAAGGAAAPARFGTLTLEGDEPRLGVGAAHVEGALVVLAGLGGPDAVRQLLSALPENLPVPVLLHQHLETGKHDRLVGQLAKASRLPVDLAEAGKLAPAGRVAVLAPGLGLGHGHTGLRFEADGGIEGLLAALPPASTTVLVLSGTPTALVPAVLKLKAGGARVMAQDPASCFDPAASDAAIAAGGESAAISAMAIDIPRHWA